MTATEGRSNAKPILRSARIRGTGPLETANAAVASHGRESTLVKIKINSHLNRSATIDHFRVPRSFTGAYIYVCAEPNSAAIGSRSVRVRRTHGDHRATLIRRLGIGKTVIDPESCEMTVKNCIVTSMFAQPIGVIPY